MCPLHGISDYGHTVREAERLAGSYVPVFPPVWHARLFNQGRVNETHYIGDINIMNESERETPTKFRKEIDDETKRYYIALNNKSRIEKIEHGGQALASLAEILKSTGEDQYCNAGDVLNFIAGELLNATDKIRDPWDEVPLKEQEVAS